MPNYVDNELKVSGPKSELLKFKEAVSNEEYPLVAERIIPYPVIYEVLDVIHNEENVKRRASNEPMVFPDHIQGRHESLVMEAALEGLNTKLPGYLQVGYDWCQRNWGTKWGFCEPMIVRETNRSIHYAFDTAWSPPIPLITKMGKMFPRLTLILRYWEGAMGFKGYMRVQEGDIVEAWDDDYRGNRGG